MPRILRQTLDDRRSFIFWWSLGMVMLAGLTALFYPSVRDSAASYEELFESLPAGLTSFLGADDAASITTPTGLLNSRLYAGIGPLLMAVFGIGLGVSLLVAEEDEGSLNLLLAQPVSRTRVLFEKFSAGVVATFFVAISIALTLLVLSPLLELNFGVGRVLSANVMLGAVSLVFCAFAFMVGAVSGTKSLAVGLSAGFAATAFVLNGFAPLIDGFEWLQKLTPFYWLQESNPLANGIDPGSLAVLLVAIAVLFGAAVIGFGRRDIDT